LVLFSIILPVLILLVVFYQRRAPLITRLLGNTAQSSKSIKRRAVASAVFFVLFIVTLITALADPAFGTRRVLKLRRGLDIALAMDISRSMEVQDVPAFEGNRTPSRLARSVRTAESLIASAANISNLDIRFAVVIGKTRAITTIPLCDDDEALYTALNNLSSSTMSSRSTNLENLAEAAVMAFADRFPAERIIILFTDGDALAGALQDALVKAHAKGCTVLAVGIGSSEGGPVPGNDGLFSSLREIRLREALSQTGGRYIDGNTDESIAVILNILRSIAPQAIEGAWVWQEERAGLRAVFIIAAVVFLCLSFLARYKKGTKSPSL
jgi:Ca-activated chloride channel family protein